MAILILIVLEALIYFKLNYYKTRTAMYELALNINNYNNLHVHTVVTSSLYGIYEYDNYWKNYEYKENANVYINSNEKLFISINEETKKIFVYENDESDAKTVTEKANQFKGLLTLDLEGWSDYTYCGIENISNKECYKVYIKHNLQEYEETLWIEKETGFVLKRETLFEGDLRTYEHTYEIGTVTNEDVARIDLQMYKINSEYEILYGEK